MGARGTKLNQNDVAADVRADYMDQLKRGKKNQEAYEFLLERYHDVIKDEEDGPLFYYVLANVQWDYGRLLDEVKEKALYYLQKDPIDVRWEDPKQIQQWKDTLRELYHKLMQPQPIEKKVSKYRLFTCSWQDGDVFAYKLDSEVAMSRGYENKYLVFRKIGNNTWWPGHIVPMVEIYNKIWDDIPSIDALESLDCLILNGNPTTFQKRKKMIPEKYIMIVIQNKKQIPIDKLLFLGNKKGYVYEEDPSPRYVNWYQPNRYCYFDTYILDYYESWNNNI